MSNEPSKKTEELQESEAWLGRLQAEATRQAASGRVPGDLRALARKADTISTEIGELAGCFDKDIPPSIQQLCIDAVQGAHPSLNLESIVGYETQDELHDCSVNLRQLADAYRETGVLLRRLSEPDADKHELRRHALYWARELEQRSGAIPASLTLLERIRDGMDEAITTQDFGGDTPWDRMQQAKQLEDGLREKFGPTNMEELDKEKMKKMMKGLFTKHTQSPVNLLETMLFEVLDATKQVNTDIQEGKIAGDMMHAIGYALRDVPAATVRR
jgi:hypothetical protein